MSGASDIGGAVSARGANGEGFAVGRAFSRAFSVFGQGYVQFVVLTVVAYVPLLLVYILLGSNPRAAVGATAFSPFVVVITPFVQMVVSSIARAACLLGAYQVMRGRSFTIGESLVGGLSRFWAVLGTSLLGGLFVGLAMLLLIVPGLIVICAIYVALPVCVIERLGPKTSLSRSWALTKGHRWPIFGLVLIVGVVAGLLSFGLAFVAVRIAGPFAGSMASLAAQVLLGAFGAVLAAVVYHDLRVDKEGVDIEQLANVFD